ncbi:hypothetical protein HRH25_06820 [Flavisolibacter sp. BT320]|nr:hypothetical protein [Flavisolibacter longurius]
MGARVFLWVCFVMAAVEGIAQASQCTFKPPFFKMHFGKGEVNDVTQVSLAHYSRVSTTCPTDGHYSYTSYTSDCFRGDWHTLEADHTPGDVDGNMLLVNSAYSEGVFFTTRVKGFKSGTTYQFGVWLMNVCRPTRKCPFPLLPNLLISLQTPGEKVLAQFSTGEISRREYPHWTQHRAQFTVPATATDLVLVMRNTAPGGCGNDFVMDDITFQECVKTDAVQKTIPKNVPVVTAKKVPAASPKPVKKATPVAKPIVPVEQAVVSRPQEKVSVEVPTQLVSQKIPLVPVPVILKQRTNQLVRQIRTEAGEIRIDLYDNGQIDGDTVSIYHNNILIVDKQLLSRKPITFVIKVNNQQPVHELVMVANNLGSIPPNTSLMTVTAKDKRHEVFISSTEQTNAKVVVRLNDEK